MTRRRCSRSAAAEKISSRLLPWILDFRPQPLHHLLLLLLLLLLVAVFGCEAALSPSPPSPLASPTLPPPEQRLLSADREAVCPCAYLERGGFWNSDIAAGLGVVNGVYVENRCRCSYAFNCARRWQRSAKSVTVTWLGSQSLSASEIQLQFCSAIYPDSLVTCSPAEVTFSLRQMGWWLDLQGVFCRCPSGAGIPGIHRFIYAKPVVAQKDPFNGRLVDFVCESKPVCQAAEWCYEELLDSNQRLTQGSVRCSCPAGAYCPIYHIGDGAREPVFNHTTQLIGYRIRCRLESKT